jgi:hypothetical protein
MTRGSAAPSRRGWVCGLQRWCSVQEPPDDPVRDARVAIWRPFEAGLLDEDHATAALLALAVGLRRMQAGRAERSAGALQADPRVYRQASPSC